MGFSILLLGMIYTCSPELDEEASRVNSSSPIQIIWHLTKIAPNGRDKSRNSSALLGPAIATFQLNGGATPSP
jgi:hypothetical protein